MRSRKRGSIINLGSTYGMVGPDFSIYEGTELTMPAAYAAIKGGIIGFRAILRPTTPRTALGSIASRQAALKTTRRVDSSKTTFAKHCSEGWPSRTISQAQPYSWLRMLPPM